MVSLAPKFRYVFVPTFSLSQEEVATTLANCRIIQVGGAPRSNTLEVIPERMYQEVMYDAGAVIELINIKQGNE